MATKRAEVAARERVEGELGAALPDEVWSRHHRVLVERLAHGTGGERWAALRELIDETKAHLDDFVAPLLAALGGKRTDDGSPLPDVGRSVVVAERQGLSDHEENRGRAFSEGIARLAGHPAGEDGQAVYEFRRVALGGRPLTAEEAFAFVRSPAVAALSFEDFAEIGASPTEHRARVEDPRSGMEDGDWGVRKFARFAVVVEPPGARVPRSFSWPLTRQADAVGKIELPVETSPDGLVLGTVRYWKHGWQLGTLTVLSDLHDLAQRLTKRYPWKEWQAGWFILTGQATWISPLTTRIEVRSGDGWDRGTVTITADLWVPAATVERVYRQIQRRRGIGADRGGKALAVWLFAADMQQATGRRPTTPELMRAWNEAHPDDRSADRSSFHDLRRRGEEAAARVLAPGVQMFLPAEAAPVAEGTPITTPKPADDGGTPRTGQHENTRI